MAAAPATNAAATANVLILDITLGIFSILYFYRERRKRKKRNMYIKIAALGPTILYTALSNISSQ